MTIPMIENNPISKEIDPAQPVGPQIYRHLRGRIISAELRPGSKMSETDLATLYGVSRQPVREAFIKLSEDGLVDIRPQRGSFVRKISVSSVMDARFVREAIEADVVRLLAQNPPFGLIEELSRQITEQRTLAAHETDLFISLDDLFHRTLAEAAGKPFAWQVIDGIKSQMDRVRQFSTRRFALEPLISYHNDIVNYIAQKDAINAEQTMRNHLQAILADLPVIRYETPEYFDDTEPT